jgi:ribosomal protein S18 acetylase RimI-like enzyme
MPESGGLVLRSAVPADVPVLASMIQTNFGAGGWGNEKDLEEELARAGRYYFIAEVEGHAIGHIGTLRDPGTVYIRGVGILPQWRGKGWGRRMLAEAVRHELAIAGDGPLAFSLDVATQNENALAIYQSCGFEAGVVYDYYRVK